MARILVDTDILIDFLRGTRRATDFVGNEALPLTISAITAAELYAGIRDGTERTALERMLLASDVLPIDSDVAKLGGLYRRDFGKSHGVGLPDALIAATASIHNLALATLNRKHYPMLENVVTPYRPPRSY